VPFILDNRKDGNESEYKKTGNNSNTSKNCMLLNRDDFMLLPGKENWLYYKLYGCSKRQNELIAYIHETLESMISEGLLKKYFFIRYSDPEPHVRLRIQASDDMLLPLFSNINVWLETLRLDGLISKITIDSYQRELERYGGAGLIKQAEEYFFHSSRLAMQIISKIRYEKSLKINIDVIGVSFIISALEAFGLTPDEQEAFLNQRSSNSENRKQFQDNRKILMKAADSRNNFHEIMLIEPYEQIHSLINSSSEKLSEYAKAVYECDKNGELTNTVHGIISSVIHMFCNRFIGKNTWEQKVYALARHSNYALRGLLKHRGE
jgi:thiopeptide-type bacteriocin biosynthesis protein